MKKGSLPVLAMLTALTVVLSLFVIIPIPPTKGFVTLAEAGIYTSALLFGGFPASLVGAVSGGMIDFLSGYPEWALFSIVIHGLQGLIAGTIAKRGTTKFEILGLVLGSIVMIVGYFLAGWLLFGLPAGLFSIIGNSIQNVLGILVTIPVVRGLRRIFSYMKN